MHPEDQSDGSDTLRMAFRTAALTAVAMTAVWLCVVLCVWLGVSQWISGGILAAGALGAVVGAGFLAFRAIRRTHGSAARSAVLGTALGAILPGVTLLPVSYSAVVSQRMLGTPTVAPSTNPDEFLVADTLIPLLAGSSTIPLAWLALCAASAFVGARLGGGSSAIGRRHPRVSWLPALATVPTMVVLVQSLAGLETLGFNMSLVRGWVGPAAAAVPSLFVAGFLTFLLALSVRNVIVGHRYSGWLVAWLTLLLTVGTLIALQVVVLFMVPYKLAWPGAMGALGLFGGATWGALASGTTARTIGPYRPVLLRGLALALVLVGALLLHHSQAITVWNLTFRYLGMRPGPPPDLAVLVNLGHHFGVLGLATIVIVPAVLGPMWVRWRIQLARQVRLADEATNS